MSLARPAACLITSRKTNEHQLRDDSHGPRTDLASFSQTSRICYEAAIPFIYSSLSIIFHDKESLQNAVSELADDGRGCRFLKYARRIYIICLKTPNLKSWVTNLLCDKFQARRYTFLDPRLTGSIADLASLHGPSKWEPIESLLPKFHHLEQFNFLTENQFTVGLSNALFHNHPNCKLDITYAQDVASSAVPETDRLNDPETINHNDIYDGELWEEDLIDEMTSQKEEFFDIDVLQLPGLHTLAMQTPRPYRNIYHNANWTGLEYGDRILPFVASAPGLRHLVLAVQSSDIKFPIAKLEKQWKNLVNVHPLTRVSTLESISIPSYGPSEGVILKLAAAIDISGLRTLSIDKYHDPANLAQIGKLFPNLERLFIGFEPSGWTSQDLDADHEDAITAVCAFRPLKYLRLHFIRNVRSVQRIVEHHGPSLKGLVIDTSLKRRVRIMPPSKDQGFKYPTFDAYNIRLLAQSCPYLEELRLQIERSAGNQAECEAYKALGGFSSLHTLVLDLNYARPKEGAEEQPLREMFVNAAIDEKLTLGIWNLINANQISRRLRYLRVMPFGSPALPKVEARLLECFPRSYLVTKCNSSSGSPTIEEIGKVARERRRHFIPKIFQQILYDIWPLMPKGTNWTSGWTSLPLEVEAV
ncbi:hypothetical protein N7520_007470 [Penicillium odoratum]|uniref:uncharacterized protein n=1 Tax=Penicillium odoratum TaxID=1167516 RepID=UPI00254825AB|nr:uncharacterized protein N7520_007470 [Penicillium odoratum]KAJ5760314.1 hypothetical protein N7520_007470 [Penicillium odoratum]